MIGVGGLGHVAVQLLRELSPARIVAIDMREDARGLALGAGAHAALDATGLEPGDVRVETGAAGAALVLDFVGVGRDASSSRRRSSRPAATSASSASAAASFRSRSASVPLEVSASRPTWGTLPELHEVVALARAGALEIEVEELGLDEAVEGYRRLRDGDDRRTRGGRAVTLEGKVAVVTGGGSGIGEAICIRLAARRRARRGARRRRRRGRLTAELVGGVAVEADVSDSASVDRALAEAEAALGPVDVWVNNAGIAAAAQAARVIPRAEQQLAEAARPARSTTPLDALVRLPDEEWRRMLAVHLDGTFFGTRAAARSMARAAERRDRQHRLGLRHRGLRRLSRTTRPRRRGILGFTRAVAKELIVQGIRVNAVAPGFIETPTAGMQSDTPLREALRLRTPLGRFGRSEEIAATVAFLAERRRRLLRRRDAQPERRHRHHLEKEVHHGRTRGRDRRGSPHAGRARASREGLLQGRPSRTTCSGRRSSR